MGNLTVWTISSTLILNQFREEVRSAMHPFPPSPFPQSTNTLFIYHAVIFAAYMFTLYLLLRRKHHPRRWDVFLVVLATFVTLTLHQTARRSHLGFPTPWEPALFFLTFLISVIGALLVMERSWPQLGEKNAWISNTVLLFQFGLLGFVYFYEIMSANSTGVRFTVERVRCSNDMRNLSIALLNYVADHRGQLPSADIGPFHRSWRVEILRYLDKPILYGEYQKKAVWNEGANFKLAQREIAFYRCLSSPVKTLMNESVPTDYAAVTGTDSIWVDSENASQFVKARDGDGLSQTLLIVESNGQNIAWSEPRDANIDQLPIGINLPGKNPGESDGIISSYHGGGANVMFADGSGRFLSQNTDPEILKKLCTATAGDRLTSSDY